MCFKIEYQLLKYITQSYRNKPTEFLAATAVSCTLLRTIFRRQTVTERFQPNIKVSNHQKTETNHETDSQKLKNGKEKAKKQIQKII